MRRIHSHGAPQHRENGYELGERAARAALKWRANNPAAPWSVMFNDVLRKQEGTATIAGMRRLEALADVLFDMAMEPAAARQFAEDRTFQESNRGE